MAHPLEIDPQEVSRLEGGQLQRLLNRLLEIEVSQAGLPVSVLLTSDQVNVPDGGIDARIDAPDFPGSEFLPPGSSIWQAKAGKSNWPDYEQELEKEDARSAVTDGYAYVMLLGRETNPKEHKVQSRKLGDAIDKVQPRAPFDIRSASHVAKWVTRYPAHWHHFGRTPGGFHDVKEFLDQQSQHDVAYVWSTATESIRDAIRARLKEVGSRVHLRIYGPAGVGKSRLVLEAFGGDADTAVYAPFANDVDGNVLRWICDRPDLTATLVIDECDLSDARRFETYVRSARGAVNLITIGADPLPELQDQYQIDPMPEDVLRAVVEGTYPEIPLDQLLWIIDKTRGFVKLAQRLAQEARRSRVDLTALDVPGLLGELFSAEEQNALTAVALCSHIGWDRDAEQEGELLSRHMGLEWRECRRLVRNLERRGFIGRAGRYRYITPELLAIWLAAEEWAANRSRLEALFTNVTPDMFERMSKRLRQMPPIDEVADLARKVLGPEGPFRDLAVLNHSRGARFFSDFSRINPEAAVSALERAFDGLGRDALIDLVAGRREIVWTLERLAAHRNLFPNVARLLLQLAGAENEHFANNATGVFRSLFNPIARKTAATGGERLDLLQTIMEADDEGEVHIAISAFSEIFDVHGGYEVSADPAGQPPPPPWAPTSWQEHADYCHRALGLLEALLDHRSEPIRAAAESMILEQFRSFFWLGLGDTALILAGRADLSENVRRRLALQTDEVITYDQDKRFMTDELMAQLKELRRTIFADPLRERLHLRLGSWNRDLYRAARDTSDNPLELEKREFRELVADMLQHSEVLRDEFEWITSEEAVKGRQFLGFLAEEDSQREWLEPVLKASVRLNRPELLASYVFGMSLTGDTADIEALLDLWADNEELQHLVPPVIATLGLTERRVVRLLALLERGFSPRALFCLEYARSEPDLTEGTLARLLRAMSAAGSPLTGTVWSILNHLRSRGAEIAWISTASFRDLMWELVGNPEMIGDSSDTYGSYSWAEAAKLLVENDPRRLASAIVEAVMLDREHLYAGSAVREVLEACFLADPAGVWEAFAKAVEGVSIGTWILTTWAAEAGVIEKVGVGNLEEWLKQDDKDAEGRIELIAKLTNVDTELTPVIRWLIARYGDSDEVMSNLESRHGARFSYGGWADMEQPGLEAARAWTKDDHPEIRKWATRRVEDLERIVRQYREMDEEEEVRR